MPATETPCKPCTVGLRRGSRQNCAERDDILQANKTLKEEKDVKLHPSVGNALQGVSLLSFPYTCSYRFSQTTIRNDFDLPACLRAASSHSLAVVFSQAVVFFQDLPASEVDGDFFGKPRGVTQLPQLLLSLLEGLSFLLGEPLVGVRGKVI